MIDWGYVFANALWIVGCALALAAFSYASWKASLDGSSLRAQLATPGSLRTVLLAGMLFSAGLGLTADAPLEIALWGVLGALFLLKLVISIIRK